MSEKPTVSEAGVRAGSWLPDGAITVVERPIEEKIIETIGKVCDLEPGRMREVLILELVEVIRRVRSPLHIMVTDKP